MLAETVGALNTKSYTYDVFDQMVQATHLSTTSPPVSESYTYDGLGRRFSVSSGGGVVTTTRHFWDGDEITYDSVSTNGTTTGYNYLHGAYTEGTIVGSTLYGNTVNLHGDVTGTYQGTTKVNAAQFDAFGRVSSSSGTFRNPYGYSGEYTDATGLQYLRARYYNPELGRFTQQDTWRDQGNPYVYCSNNPVMYTDPSGHCEEFGVPDVKTSKLMIPDQWFHLEAVPGFTYTKIDLYCGNAPFYEVTMSEGSKYCAEWMAHYNMTHPGGDAYAYSRKHIASIFNIKYKSDIVVPSSDQIVDGIVWDITGKVLDKTGKGLGKITHQVPARLDENNIIRFAPSCGFTVQKYPNISKAFTVGDTVIEFAGVGFDVANTLTEHNNNTLGKRVAKAGIQIGGAAVSFAVGYAIAATINAWNPGGWVMIGAAAVGFMISWGTDIIIEHTQEKLYEDLNIE